MWWVLIVLGSVGITLAHLNYPHVAGSVVAKLLPRRPSDSTPIARLVKRTVRSDWYSVGTTLEQTGIKKVIITADGDIYIGCDPSFDAENKHKVVVYGGVIVKVTGEFNTELLVHCDAAGGAVWIDHGNNTKVEAKTTNGNVIRQVVPLKQK